MRFVAYVVSAFLMMPFVTHAAFLYTEVPTGPYGPGDTFIASVRLDNEDACINAGHIEVSYPADLVKPVDFSKGDSLFTLWVGEPVFEKSGTVVFEGGIPGGYCGRIEGDPSLSNVLGKIVFTVVGAERDVAELSVSPESALYLSDGLGTPTEVRTTGTQVALVPVALGAENPWLAEIEADTVPPDPFAVIVESTEGVFDGYYYAVFATVDKQSGLDHYELFERGVWKVVESPYKLRDQSLEGGVEVRAIDKAGNIQVATFDPLTVPERKAKPSYLLYAAAVILLAAAGLGAAYLDKRRYESLSSHEA
jgi:hypothetical protein